MFQFSEYRGLGSLCIYDQHDMSSFISMHNHGAVCLTCEEPPAGAAEDAEQGGAQVLVQEQEQQGVDDGVHEGHVQGHLETG